MVPHKVMEHLQWPLLVLHWVVPGLTRGGGAGAYQVVVRKHFPVTLETVFAGGHMPQAAIHHAGSRHVLQLLIPKLIPKAFPSCKSQKLC